MFVLVALIRVIMRKKVAVSELDLNVHCVEFSGI